MYTDPGSKPAGVNSLYVCTACRERGVRRNRYSFVTTQMVDRNEGLDLPADSRFYTCAESEKLYHHCCIDPRGYGRVQIPFPSGIIKIANGGAAVERKIREEIERKIDERSRRGGINPAGDAATEETIQKTGPFLAFTPTKVNRVSGTHKSIGKKRNNKVRIEFAVNVRGKR